MKTEEWLEIEKFERMQTGAGEIAVDRYVPPRERAVMRLYGTDWDVGQLTLHLADPEAKSEPGIVKFQSYPMKLAMHPRRGIANVRVIAAAPEMDARSYAREVGERARMTTAVLRDAVRQELEEGPVAEFWEDRRLPIEPVFVFRSGCQQLEPEEIGIDPTRVVEASWEEFPARLADKMPERAAANASDVDPVRNMIERVVTLTDDYIDHEDLLRTWDFAVDQLLEENDRAA